MHISSTSLFSTFAKNRLRSSARLGLKALAGLALAGAFAASSVAQTPTPCAAWSAGAPLPVVGGVRAVGNYFPANGLFYAMGGRSADTAGSDFTHPFEYNPATNTWTTKVATYPDNQVNNMACGVLTVSGTPQIYCVGGSAAGAAVATARVFSYNPATDTITTLTAPDNWPGNAIGTILPGGFAVAGNKLYIIGGFNINVSMTAQTWQFDPTAAVGSRWLQRLDYPVARGYVPAATIGGLIYTGGGADFVAALLVDTADSYKYDPATNIWTAIANIPRATGETRAVVMNSEMWVLGGGRTAPNPSTEVDIYTPASNTWTTGLPFATGRRNFPADSDGSSRIWLAGGYDVANLLLNTMQIYGPGVCPTPTPTPSGTPSPTPTATATATPTATPPCTPSYTTATTTGTITAGGTDIGNHCDDCDTQVNLPFPVSVYGNPPISVAYAGSNGDIQFTTTPSAKVFYWPGCVPVNPDPTMQGPFLNTLFPYYDDLRTDVNPLQTCSDCGIFTQTLGTAPNRQFVIRWKTTYFNFAGTAESEVLLTEGSNTLSVIYGASENNGLTAVSGIQQDLNVFTSFSCLQAVLTPGVRVNYIPTGCGSPTPTPTPPPFVSISGTVIYCSGNPVPGVTMTLTGTMGGSTLTDGSGNYTFAGLPSGGNYTVTPSKANLTPGAGTPAINGTDLLAVQRHFLNIALIPAGCRRVSADVNGVFPPGGDGQINGTDVLGIQHFFLNVAGIANVGKYKFTPVNRSYLGLVTNQTAQNYDALAFGDVNSAFVHRPEGPSQDAPEVPATVAAVALPEVALDQSKSNFTAAVRSSEIEAKNNLVGFQGDFTFDERVVTFQSEPVQKAGITGGNWNVSGNVLPGTGPIRTLRILAYSNDFTPLSGSGTLFELNMTRVSKAAQDTPLLWAAPPNQFIFIDADLNTQSAGNAAPGSVMGALKR